MKRRRERKKGGAAQLEMTPMIDVVFQLLIFFIVTLKQEDILAHLDVSRPAPDPNATPEVDPKLIEILVYNKVSLGGEGYSMRGRRVSLKELDRQLSRLAKFNSNTSIIIKCTGDSRHAELVGLLNICKKANLSNLAVFSM